MPEKALSQKLFIKDGYRVLLLNAPDNYANRLTAEAPKAAFSTKADRDADLIQLFVSSEAELKAQLPPAKTYLKEKGLMWVTYPKGSTKKGADINRDSIREYALTIGLDTVAMIAVDDVWSAMRMKQV